MKRTTPSPNHPSVMFAKLRDEIIADEEARLDAMLLEEDMRAREALRVAMEGTI